MESSGGVASLKDTPGSESDSGLVSKDVCVMTMDNKEQKSLPAESLQWVLHVTETLKRFVLISPFYPKCMLTYFIIFFFLVTTSLDLMCLDLTSGHRNSV